MAIPGSHAGKTANETPASFSKRRELLDSLGRLLGLSAFFHFGYAPGLAKGVHGMVLLGATLLFLAFPRGWYFQVLMVVLSGTYFWEQKFVIGQSHLLLLFCLTAHLGWNVARAARRPGMTLDNLGQRVLTTLRTAAVSTYAFAFLHKLNSSYLQCSTSRITFFFPDFLWNSDNPTRFDNAACLSLIWASLAIEGALAGGLLFQRTRTLAVGLGLAFHFMLGFAGIHAFSSLMFCLLLAFEPRLPAVLSRLIFHEKLAKLMAQQSFQKRTLFLKLSGGAVLFFCALRFPVGPERAFWQVSWLFAALAIAVFWRPQSTEAPALDAAAPGQSSHVLHAAAVGMMLAFFGLGPYLGYRNVLAFDMFSGLRVVGFETNHLLVPGSLQLDFFQGDLVRVKETNVAELEPLTSNRGRIPKVYLQAMMDRVPESSLNGCELTLETSLGTRFVPCRQLRNAMGWKTFLLHPYLFHFKPQ